MYGWMYVCMSMWLYQRENRTYINEYIITSEYLHSHIVQKYEYVVMSTVMNLSVYTSICIHIYTYILIHIYTYILIHIYIYMSIYVCIYTQICIYIHIYTYTNIYTYIYTG
jgi:hypothetical protein